MTWLVFWVSLAALLYVYAGFSLLLILVGLLKNRGVRTGPITPRMSLIIAAHNEERAIARRLENALEVDYPADALEILVASDGSTDTTNTIVSRYAARGVRLLALPRSGKLSVLHQAVAQSHGDVLVFSDANTTFHPQALRMLARNFADPEVGGVCGNQIYVREEKADSSTSGETLYWSYDKWLKATESRTGSIVSSDGAIYAIRRGLYRKPARACVTDDFAISTAVVEQGYRLVFENEAIAYEHAAAAADREFRRKVRIINRGLHGVLLRKRLLNPFRYGVYAWILFSHKVARRLAPFFLLALLASSLVLAPQGGVYSGAVAAQVGFYVLAFLGYLFKDHALGRWKVLYAPFFYCLANAAALVAVTNLLLGNRIEQWQPERPAASMPFGKG
jgi:cellulose synthase/poly-beta-1,6-N-acetylglucosamine synthase-like glycosyltransferase